MVQPFRSAIQTEGEHSLILFNGKASHSLLKTPKQGDFRSQSGFGAFLREQPIDGELKNLAEDVLSRVAPNSVRLTRVFINSIVSN